MLRDPGDSDCEAYTAIAWGVGSSLERSDIAGAEGFRRPDRPPASSVQQIGSGSDKRRRYQPENRDNRAEQSQMDCFIEHAAAIYGFNASRVTRSTLRSTNADSASSSARNSERARGRSNSTNTSRSLFALAVPRYRAEDREGPDRPALPEAGRRNAKRRKDPSLLVMLQPNTGLGRPLGRPRLQRHLGATGSGL